MKLTFEHRGTACSCLTTEAKSIGIMMDFDGPQPNHFGTQKASSEKLKLGGFVGDTAAGGSCNVDVLKLIPHCNGTHTETVSHIVNEDIWIGHAAMDMFGVAALVSITPTPAHGSGESYRPPFESKDQVVTATEIRKACKQLRCESVQPDALIIRTKPNPIDKTSRAYSEKQEPPFLTVEAIEAVNELGVRHLLLDMPSVDRMYDDGLLTNHHIFWNVKEGTHELTGETWQDKTITEMVYIPDEIEDGFFALNLQVPLFASDAAPSRPVIMPITFNQAKS